MKNSLHISFLLLIFLFTILTGCGINDNNRNDGTDPIPEDENLVPVANAGFDQDVPVGSQFTCDGSNSSDIDGDPLTYTWILISKPSGSNTILSSTVTPNPSATIDVAGSYVLSLVVNDGTVKSIADTVTINAYPIFKVPDTGQSISYTNIFGEDSDYSINSPSFIDYLDGTLTDNISNLMWQKQDDETLRVWDDAINYCESLTLGGHNDWRLPAKKELVSIVFYEKNEDAVDITYFTNTLCVGQEYWSSTPYYNESSIAAWEFRSHRGDIGGGYKADPKCVRCVRGDDLVYANFENMEDGTVIDKSTTLVWQKDGAGEMEWENAIAYCEALSLANYSDWRLPNIKELESIVDDSTRDPAIDTTYFLIDLSDLFWSSTAYPGKLASSPLKAWYVDFDYGSANFSYPNNSFNVRCVRGGQ